MSDLQKRINNTVLRLESWDMFFSKKTEGKTTKPPLVACRTNGVLWGLYTISVRPDFVLRDFDISPDTKSLAYPDGTFIPLLEAGILPMGPLWIFVDGAFASRDEEITQEEALHHILKENKKAAVYWLPWNQAGTFCDGAGNRKVYDKICFSQYHIDDLRPLYTNRTAYSLEYLRQVNAGDFSMRVVNEHLVAVRDCAGPYLNCEGGRRRTTGVPAVFEKTIHIFGASQTFGIGVEDKNTFCSVLQQRLNECGHAIRVVNYGFPRTDFARFRFQVQNTRLQKGDIVLLSANIHAGYDSFQLDAYADFIKDIGAHCREQGCWFAYFQMPCVRDLATPTKWEETLASFFPDVPPNLDARSHFGLRCAVAGIPCVDLTPAFVAQHGTSGLFVDYFHWADRGHAIVAEEMLRVVHQFLAGTGEVQLSSDALSKKKTVEQNFDHMLKGALVGDGCFDFVRALINKFGDASSKNCGSIVVNCNPFTKGHRYLIETAAAKVEQLYVFVLEEDQSFFPFADRLELVQQNTQDLANVIVAPSGSCMISSITFPEYFAKDSVQQNAVLDMSMDISAFGANIAPALGIKKRFVGQEPYCKVTNAYNEQMKRLLPEYGVEVVEIPRLVQNGQPISASDVRRLLAEKCFDDIEKIVPKITLEYLKEHYG